MKKVRTFEKLLFYVFCSIVCGGHKLILWGGHSMESLETRVVYDTQLNIKINLIYMINDKQFYMINADKMPSDISI